MRPDDYDHGRGYGHDRDEPTIDAAGADLKAEFLGRRIDAEERQRRDRAGQRRLLGALDDDLIYEYVETIEHDHAN